MFFKYVQLTNNYTVQNKCSADMHSSPIYYKNQ